MRRSGTLDDSLNHTCSTVVIVETLRSIPSRSTSFNYERLSKNFHATHGQGWSKRSIREQIRPFQKSEQVFSFLCFQNEKIHRNSLLFLNYPPVLGFNL